MHLIIVFGVCVCRSFIVSLCMFTVSKALLISRGTVIVRSGGCHLIETLAIVLLKLCNAVIVEWRL